MQNTQYVQLAAQTLSRAFPQFFKNGGAEWGIILGTGLSDITKEMEEIGRLPFTDIPDFPASSVRSHAGAFVIARVKGVPAIIQQGRCHLYEGRSPAEVCMGARLMGELGVKNLIATNAAGALNPLFEPGTLMLMADMINHTGVSPLTGPNNDAWGERFPDMSEPFDKNLRALAMRCSLEQGIRLETGVYIGTHGPEMETPAETRMYRQWGADAIGMSTVLEIIAARHMGMKVMGLSCIANKNLPDCMRPAPLAEIIDMSAVCGRDLSRLLLAFFASIDKKTQ